MAKVTNMRERVHQPFRDALIRTSGMYAGTLDDITDLFTQPGRGEGISNLKQGSVLPSDQSMVILVLRVMLHFYAPVARSEETLTGSTGRNGDYFVTAAHEAAAANLLNGSVPGDVYDLMRLYMQASEQLLWDFGAGDKFSLKSMPSSYFPWGGGLHGDVGGATDLLYFCNGEPGHDHVLRLGRAITLPPRQNVSCVAKMVRLPDGGNAATFGATQGSRIMHDLKSNLNAVDLVHKTIVFCFDGLFSRDVQ